MKKLGLIVKESQEEHVKENLKLANGFFILKCSGLSSPDLTILRQSLRESRAKLLVVKNSVARRALNSAGLKILVNFIEGPCSLVFIQDEPAGVSRVLYNFSKEHAGLKLEAGFLEDRVLEKNEIETLAKLPTKEVLRAQIVGAIASSLLGLLGVLKGNLNKLVYVLEKIKEKKPG